MAVDIFSIPIFFIVLRETLETSIIVSVLLAFLKQTLDTPNHDSKLYKALVKQVWLGTLTGFLLSLLLGAALVSVFYVLGRDIWGDVEFYWEGVFSILAALVIAVMGAALLRVAKMQDKWRRKLVGVVAAGKRGGVGALGSSGGVGSGNAERAPLLQGQGRRFTPDGEVENEEDGENLLHHAGEERTLLQRRDDVKPKDGSSSSSFTEWTERYAMFILPFTTVLREGIEGIVFVAGVTFTSPVTAIPLAVVVGLLTGSLVGWFIYKSGTTGSKLQIFLVISTGLLYLVGAGLFSKGVWFFEAAVWNRAVGGDAAEVGSGPGSYDIRRSVWHVNYGNPLLPDAGWWGLFNGVLGWQNSATYGSVVSYNVYWIVVIIGFLLMRFYEVHGRLPFARRSKGKGRVRTRDVEGNVGGEEEAQVELLRSSQDGSTEAEGAARN